MPGMDGAKARWRKSSYSNSFANCVEAMLLPDGDVLLRDSKNPDGPVLTFTRTEWEALTDGVKSCQFDYWRLPVASAH
jgi:hypothetical protein